MQVQGFITRRRCFGSNLAFADVQVIGCYEYNEEENDGISKNDTDDDFQKSIRVDKEPNKGEKIQIIFQRDSDVWDKASDETFPNKQSKLPYGGEILVVVAVAVVATESSSEHLRKSDGQDDEKEKKSYLVRKWKLLNDPKVEALKVAKYDGTDGISCSLYLKSRGDAYRKFNEGQMSQQPHQQQDEEYPKTKKKTTTIKGPQPSPATEAIGPENTSSDSASTMDQGQFSHGDKRAKALRATIFASWLLQTYGTENLQLGSGVMDVAGGKGKLSIELSVQGKVPCTIIDPLVRKRGSKLEPRDAKRIRKVEAPHPQLLSKMFNTSSFVEEFEELIANSSMLVGLHPDEATEDILDVALQLNKPVALVPCCVFPGFFPFRFLSCGTPVRTYEQFLQYLLAKDERLQMETLPFQGRNVVIYLPVTT